MNYELQSKIYPNPIQSQSVVSYQLSSKSPVNIKIFDLTGKEIITLVDEIKDKGSYQFDVNLNTLHEGIYFCRIKTMAKEETLKLVVIR